MAVRGARTGPEEAVACVVCIAVVIRTQRSILMAWVGVAFSSIDINQARRWLSHDTTSQVYALARIATKKKYTSGSHAVGGCAFGCAFGCALDMRKMRVGCALDVRWICVRCEIAREIRVRHA